jgi:hypothetical protein
MKGVWVRRPQGSAVAVFVHGLNSSGQRCWQHDNGSYWPELLERERAPQLKGIGIYVFTYQTDVFSGSFLLSNVVDSLKEHMRLEGVLACAQLVFVCHSMGGIVVRKFIVEREADLVNKALGLFLVASPSLGSSYANWLAPLSKFLGHAQADALRFAQNNAWLNDLDKQFLNLKEAERLTILGKELVEDKFVVLPQLLRKQVVEPFSGARYFAESYKVPGSDHFSIAKPENDQAIQHRQLCDFLDKTLTSRKAVKVGSVDPRAELKEPRSQTTDRDIAFLREAKGRVTYPKFLSADSGARAPKGEKWEAETEEKANARARRLIQLGLMEERGGGEVELSELGRALVTDDDRQKGAAGDAVERTRVAAEKAWDDVVMALGKLSELSSRHVKAVAEVAGPILTERNLLETSRRYSQLVNDDDFPVGYDEVRGILAATKSLPPFKAADIQALVQNVIARLQKFQLGVFTIRWDSHHVADAVAEAARVASSGADVSPDEIARAAQLFSELFTKLFQEPVPQLADPPTKDALVDLVQRWFQSWQRHVQRSLYGGVGLNSAIAQLKMQRHNREAP